MISKEKPPWDSSPWKTFAVILQISAVSTIAKDDIKQQLNNKTWSRVTGIQTEDHRSVCIWHHGLYQERTLLDSTENKHAISCAAANSCSIKPKATEMFVYLCEQSTYTEWTAYNHFQAH